MIKCLLSAICAPSSGGYPRRVVLMTPSPMEHNVFSLKTRKYSKSEYVINFLMSIV